jgi:hypothetical protein
MCVCVGGGGVVTTGLCLRKKQMPWKGASNALESLSNVVTNKLAKAQERKKGAITSENLSNVVQTVKVLRKRLSSPLEASLACQVPPLTGLISRQDNLGAGIDRLVCA